MTYDDDFIRLNLKFIGPQTFQCNVLELQWPPPERLFIGDSAVVRPAHDDDDIGQIMVCTNRSQITDEERADMTQVCRGAEYFYANELEVAE